MKITGCVPLPGEGVVARHGDLVAVTEASGPAPDPLLGALEEVSADAGDGAALVLAAARAMLADLGQASGACAGITAGGEVAVLVQGDATVAVTVDGGDEVQLTASGSMLPVNRTFSGTIVSLRMAVAGPVDLDPRLHLDGGVVYGSGLLVTASADVPGGLMTPGDASPEDAAHPDDFYPNDPEPAEDLSTAGAASPNERELAEDLSTAGPASPDDAGVADDGELADEVEASNVSPVSDTSPVGDTATDMAPISAEAAPADDAPAPHAHAEEPPEPEWPDAGPLNPQWPSAEPVDDRPQPRGRETDFRPPAPAPGPGMTLLSGQFGREAADQGSGDLGPAAGQDQLSGPHEMWFRSDESDEVDGWRAPTFVVPEPAPPSPGREPKLHQPDPESDFESVLLVSQPGAPEPDDRDQDDPYHPHSAEASPAPLSSPVPQAEADLYVPDPVLVEGVLCARNHFNDPSVQYCRQCGISMVQQTRNVQMGQRPPLGVLLLDDGTGFTLDRDYVVGREPVLDGDVAAGRARPLRITDPDGTVSRLHLRISLVGWQVEIRDLGSANGSVLHLPSGEQRLTPYDPVLIQPGARIGIGRRSLQYLSYRAG